MEQETTRNAIIVDADYADEVAFHLIVNFERMLGRQIPQADLARWLDCVALDGGMRPAEGPATADGAPAAVTTQVVLLHAADRARLDNFAPADYAQELDGKAFTDSLGEFIISTPAVAAITTREQQFCDTLDLFLSDAAVHRIMVVPAEESLNAVTRHLRKPSAQHKDITLFTMQPQAGVHCAQQLLGYSLMAALGIRGEEIHPE